MLLWLSLEVVALSFELGLTDHCSFESVLSLVALFSLRGLVAGRCRRFVVVHGGHGGVGVEEI